MSREELEREEVKAQTNHEISGTYYVLFHEFLLYYYYYFYINAKDFTHMHLFS